MSIHRIAAIIRKEFIHILRDSRSLGMAIAMPCLTILALDPFPEQRGLAASCQTFLQTSGNSLGAGLIVPLLWDSPRHLAFGMVGLLALGALSALLQRRELSKINQV